MGAGVMGAGIAQVFATAGYPVKLQDIGEAPLSRGMGAIKKSLERLVARDKLKPEARDATLQRIAPTTRIEDLAECDVVVEAVLERFDVKKEVFGNLDRVCRAEAILATTPPPSRSPASPRPPGSRAASSACTSSIPCR